MERPGVQDSPGGDHGVTAPVVPHPGDGPSEPKNHGFGAFPEKTARQEGEIPNPSSFLGRFSLAESRGLSVFKTSGESSSCTASGVGQKNAGRTLAFMELRELCLDGLDVGMAERFKGLLHEGLPEKRCALQLGLTVLQLLLSSPRDGSFLAGVSAPVKTDATPNLRDRDVLPLPVPPVGAVLHLCRHLVRSPTGLLKWDPQCFKQMGKQQLKKLVKASCFQLWRLLMVSVLNGEYQSWDGPCFGALEFPGNASQVEAFEHLDSLCQYFARNPLCERCGMCPRDVIKSKGVDYAGGEVLHALPLKVGELLPGLPADGVAGSLQASDVAVGDVAQWVTNPELALLPRDSWPNPLPQASMICSTKDWHELVPLLVKKRILEPISKSEIFTVNGTPLLNGAFAVPMKGTPGEGQVRVTRLIMNMIPSNSLQRLMQGDLATLSGSAGWVGAHLSPNQVLLWSGEDQRGAYYAWSLPHAWRKFMVFKWPVPGELVGKPGVSEVYLAAAVIPMGWLNAVGLFQHLHRRLGLAPPPSGAGHCEDQEWRRDRPVPSSAVSEDGGWVQFYLDDFDCPEFVDRKVWKRLQETMSANHHRQLEAYRHVGVEISEDKSHVREPRVIRMGAEVDGVAGFIGPPSEKLLETGWLCVWLLSRACVGIKPLLMALGRLVRCFEFRRPLLSILDQCWPREQYRFRRTINQNTARELVRALCALPLAVGSLRTPFSGLVTCSDASTEGGGLCASAGLTSEGMNMLNRLESGEVHCFQPAGALPLKGVQGPRVVVVSIFDDIGALTVALTRLPCQVVCYVSSEVDREQKKVIRRRWPGVIELGNISTVDEKQVELLQRSTGGHVDLVLAGVRCPCQEYGAGAQSPGAQLFTESLRAINLLKSCFMVPVHYLVENIASLTPEERDNFSHTLGMKPFLIDARWFTWCRRPRLFWCSWSPVAQSSESMTVHEGYTSWDFPMCRDNRESWVEPGCVWKGDDDGWLPDLTQPKSRVKAPNIPLGIAEASTGAVQRWQADSFRVPVLNYEESAMVVDATGALRLPSLSERELLMGFDKDYIGGTLPHKMNNTSKFELGSRMIGKAQCVHVLVMLCHSLLSLYGLTTSRDHAALVRQVSWAPPAWLLFPRFVKGSWGTKESEELVKHFCRQAEKGGTDVRLDVGVPFRARAWPRAGINSSWFNWSVVHGYVWKHDAHINVLELQAVINGLKWRLRRAGNGRCRILHLIDNQVVCAIVAKGRSSSARLKKGLKKLNSLVLASGVVLAVGYVSTDANPSDIPSRWGARLQLRRKKTGKKSVKAKL